MQYNKTLFSIIRDVVIQNVNVIHKWQPKTWHKYLEGTDKKHVNRL